MAYNTPAQQQPTNSEPEKIYAGEPDSAANIADLMELKEKTEKGLVQKECEIKEAKSLLSEPEAPSVEVEKIYETTLKVEKYWRVITEIIKALDSNPKTMLAWRNVLSQELLKEVEEILDRRG